MRNTLFVRNIVLSHTFCLDSDGIALPSKPLVSSILVATWDRPCHRSSEEFRSYLLFSGDTIRYGGYELETALCTTADIDFMKDQCHDAHAGN